MVQCVECKAELSAEEAKDYRKMCPNCLQDDSWGESGTVDYH